MMPAMRWKIFCEFAIAGFATSCATLALLSRRRLTT
jgi:hypothetical protein